MQGLGRRDARDGLVCGALGACVITAIALYRGDAFWSTSDGVYAQTARAVTDGAGLYSDVAAAQPPPVYLFGALLLELGDSLTAVRAGVGLLTLLTALLVWVAVLRLTNRPWAAGLAGVATPLTPVMLHETALLTPENLGAPVLMALVLVGASERGRPVAAGLVGGAAVACKLSFAVPVVAVLAMSRARVRALAVLGVAVVLLAAVATAVYGAAIWDGVVVAQSRAGPTPAREFAGLMAQVIWNTTPLGLIAAMALLLRNHVAEPRLLWTTTAAAAGGLALSLSTAKLGSYVNVVQVAEPPLLVLAACALAVLPEAIGRHRRARALAIAATLAVLLAVAQSASLLLEPDDPRPYTRPFAESGPRRLLSPAEVSTLAAAARACPRDAPYPGIPFVAFVAGRRVPGDQPDRFILASHPDQIFFATRIANDRPPCPRDAPDVDAAGRVG